MQGGRSLRARVVAACVVCCATGRRFRRKVARRRARRVSRDEVVRSLLYMSQVNENCKVKGTGGRLGDDSERKALGEANHSLLTWFFGGTGLRSSAVVEGLI